MTVDHDTRPTQAEVEAMAAEMFGGEAWKAPFEHRKALIDAMIAERLDAARAAVLEQQR